MRALVAEGNKSYRDYLVGALGAALPELECIAVSGGHECLSLARREYVHVVILGDMTDMTALEVIEDIRHVSGAPIMVLSNSKDESALVAAFEAGADGYMTRPIRPKELAARLTTLLKGGRWRHRAIASTVGPAGGNQVSGLEPA